MKHDKLINSGLYKFYNIFDTVFNHALDANNLCNSDDTYKCVHISIHDLYKKVLSNLRRISNRDPVFTDEMPKDYYKVCDYFNYMFYEMLININFRQNEVNTFFHVFNQKKNTCSECPCEFFLTNVSAIAK
ncbi:PIR Superfamily Protein [Plasmodium ovale wallikeri]|uniref:PIR Superfamily Protein n=1 Tax=Plasmodium ovale wallikeri TaxID=864142 RepID=A0A1A9AGB4_PLAOA|nr:PIR Superfamily Protein [Plasmodium ovale wallikeri]SBT55601.1 PIR Superfamily Protein [Plasmodium ovale wallikeri]